MVLLMKKITSYIIFFAFGFVFTAYTNIVFIIKFVLYWYFLLCLLTFLFYFLFFIYGFPLARKVGPRLIKRFSNLYLQDSG
jgi:hypothetical protein